MFAWSVRNTGRNERGLRGAALVSLAVHAAFYASALRPPHEQHGMAADRAIEVSLLESPRGPAQAAPRQSSEPAAESGSPVAEPLRAPALATAQRTPERERAQHAPAVSNTPRPSAAALPVIAAASTAEPELAAETAADTSAATPGDSAPRLGANPGGVPGGSGQGTPGVSAGPARDGAATSGRAQRLEVLPFGPGMTQPQLLSGRQPVYTREARIARVHGTMIAQCVITTAGALQNCRLLKSLPHMDRAVLDALATRRYTPVLFQGQPVRVQKVFTIRLVLPD